MAVNVCSADRVQAPVEVVWDLLMHPAGYGGFWEMTVERVEPEGLAAVGQGFFAWTLCRRLRIDGEILEVDAVRHTIRFHTTLPFGAGCRQPDRVFADQRRKLHAPLRLRLLVPARVAGPIAESPGWARARQRRGLAPPPKARCGGACATGGQRLPRHLGRIAG